jgi:hypothetical protein
MEFTKVVANIALLILILSLTIIGSIMYKGRHNQVSDNVVIGECPDYWNMVKEGDTNYCVNVKNLGKKTCPSKMNFFAPPWTTSDGTCQKNNWARNCDLTWDGITNNTSSCSKKPY